MRALFDPYPCQKRAAFLSERLRRKLGQSLAYLLQFNQHILQIPKTAITDLQALIETSKKIPSLLFALNSLLLEATQKNEVEHYRSYINLLMNCRPLEEVQYLDYQAVIEDNLSSQHTHHHSTQDETITLHNLLKKYMLFDLFDKAEIFPPKLEDSIKTKILIQNALTRIQSVDPETYQEMMIFISEVMVFSSGSLKVKAGSSFDIFGIVYLNSSNGYQSVINMIDCLIHEAAHLYLYSLSAEDALVSNPYVEHYYSPIRHHDRPLIGIFHAAFVLTRVILFFNKMLCSTFQNDNSSKEIQILRLKYHKIVSESVETVMKYGQLTSLGAKMMNNIMEVLNLDSIPPEIPLGYVARAC